MKQVGWRQAHATAVASCHMRLLWLHVFLAEPDHTCMCLAFNLWIHLRHGLKRVLLAREKHGDDSVFLAPDWGTTYFLKKRGTII